MDDEQDNADNLAWWAQLENEQERREYEEWLEQQDQRFTNERMQA